MASASRRLYTTDNRQKCAVVCGAERDNVIGFSERAWIRQEDEPLLCLIHASETNDEIEHHGKRL